MDLLVSANRAQLPKLLLGAKTEISVEGRGTGKSFDIGFKIDQIVRNMPGAVVALTGKTYGQLLTRTLPSSLKLLAELGYQQGVNFVIGRRPPASFRDSHERINRFENVISFSNGTRLAMISQSESGSGRGANVDFEILDEALLIDREAYNNEVAPTNRGNLEHFGRLSSRPVWLHHGSKYSTSMPISKESQWILDFADYYLKERGVRLLDGWNRVVMLQVEAVEMAERWRRIVQRDGLKGVAPSDLRGEARDVLDEFKGRWGRVEEERRALRPFVSKEGVLFTLSNAFDNIGMLGMDYLVDNRRRLPHLVFMTEIMNLHYDRVEDGFYQLEQSRHVYYNFYDTDRAREAAERGGFVDVVEDCRMDRDCDPGRELELSFDWGSHISLLVVHQEREMDFVTGELSAQRCQTQINEFYVKPDDGASSMMIVRLLDQFIRYYAPHPTRRIVYYADRYGDHRNPAVLNAATYNQMAVEHLERAGWRVEVVRHAGQEPPQSDRFLLWGMILAERTPSLPKFRINGDRCRYTLISMNNARVRDYDGQLKKDKSSERAHSGVLPEEATHFSDAVDKIVWTKYGPQLPRGSGGGDGSDMFFRW